MQERVKLNRPVELPKRQRRTHAEIEEFEAAIHQILEDDNPMTVRQVFYQLVNRGLVEKTDGPSNSGYEITKRQLGVMRKKGTIPYDWIEDGGRELHESWTFENIKDAVDQWVRVYRRNALDECCKSHVQVWVEKEALASQFKAVTRKYDVPLVVMRGQPSLSLSYEATERIRQSGLPCIIYHFGDYDPSGQQMTETIRKHMQEIAPDLDIEVDRAALTRAQVDRYHLPTRPTKTKGNTHAKSFDDDESVELDALPKPVMTRLIRGAINNHISEDDVEELRELEERERDELRKLANKLTA